MDYSGGVNADAIRAALINEVEGVSGALVYENDTDENNVTYNLPPHSIEAVVYGGLDEDIAKTIYGRKSGGIQTVGSETVNVMTASGQQIPINFSRPTPKKIYIQITGLRTGTEYTGEDAIKQALIDYIGDGVSGGLEIGTDVVYIKLPGILTALPGIEDFDIQIGTDGSDYGKSNISIGYREKAITDDSAITITMAA